MSMLTSRRALAAGHRPRSFLMAARWLTDLTDVVAQAREGGIPVYAGGPQFVPEALACGAPGAVSAAHPQARILRVIDEADLGEPIEHPVDHI